MSDRKIVNSILLFNKKYSEVVKSGQPYRINNELHPKLKTQLDSIISQAKKMD